MSHWLTLLALVWVGGSVTGCSEGGRIAQPLGPAPIPQTHSAGADRGSDDAVERCGFSPDSTLGFHASVAALGAFLDRALAPYRDAVPADRIVFAARDSGCSVQLLDIYDLADTGNASTAWGDSVYFAPGHAYHVYALWHSVSFSHIAFFESDTTVIFEAVNCTDHGDTVDDAVAYLKARHPERWSEAYEARIRTYREYGHFQLTDPIVPSLLCACEICFLPPSRQPGGHR